VLLTSSQYQNNPATKCIGEAKEIPAHLAVGQRRQPLRQKRCVPGGGPIKGNPALLNVLGGIRIDVAVYATATAVISFPVHGLKHIFRKGPLLPLVRTLPLLVVSISSQDCRT
jgi:hypothetical protein